MLHGPINIRFSACLPVATFIQCKLYCTVNTLLVLTECVASETVTVRGEDNVLRVFENKKLSRIFGPSGEKVKGG